MQMFPDAWIYGLFSTFKLAAPPYYHITKHLPGFPTHPRRHLHTHYCVLQEGFCLLLTHMPCFGTVVFYQTDGWHFVQLPVNQLDGPPPDMALSGVECLTSNDLPCSVYLLLYVSLYFSLCLFFSLPMSPPYH